MKLKFTKMHGLGNDFIVIDAINQSVELTTEQVRRLADRRFGVGCDQILIVERPTQADTDFRYRIFNADGGEVEQCGNGARCFVRFVVDKHLTNKTEIRVETKSGIISPKLVEGGLITVDMGIPVLAPAYIPFDSDSNSVIQSLEVNGQKIDITAVSMGNPHAVQIVDNVEEAPVATQGPAIESHPRFPARVNAGFMQIIDQHSIRLRVFERGAGETLACGTGACAAVVTGVLRNQLISPVKVQTHGGSLSIAWDGLQKPVLMTGPAVTVFEGETEI